MWTYGNMGPTVSFFIMFGQDAPIVGQEDRPLAFRMKRSDKSLEKAVRRMARGEIDRALELIEAERGDTLPATIHGVRKRAKRLRGLLRLVRPALPAYAHENGAIREAARLLSPLRDRSSLITTYDRLLADNPAVTDRRPYGAFRAALTRAEADAAADPETMEALRAVALALRGVRDRTGKWKLKDHDAAAFSAGAEITMKRAAKALKAARKSHDHGRTAADEVHELRKRTKYHRFHIRILAPVWPEVMEPRMDQADRLGDLLGFHHDLAVLVERSRTLELPADLSTRAALHGLAETRQADILTEALPIADRLFAEDPEAVTDRWRALYAIWRAEA